MSYYNPNTKRYETPVMHGPQCDCDVCRGQRVANTERLTSTDRLAWLESRVMQLQEQITQIAKGNNNMGYALWCKTGDHSFDEDDKNAERMTVDERDENGKKTGREITIHVCSRHVKDMLAPRPKSLEDIRRQIDEASSIE